MPFNPKARKTANTPKVDKAAPLPAAEHSSVPVEPSIRPDEQPRDDGVHVRTPRTPITIPDGTRSPDLFRKFLPPTPHSLGRRRTIILPPPPKANPLASRNRTSRLHRMARRMMS